jgi:hypothetical protein
MLKVDSGVDSMMVIRYMKIDAELSFSNMKKGYTYRHDFDISTLLKRISLDRPATCKAIGYAYDKQGAQAGEVCFWGRFLHKRSCERWDVYSNLNKLIRLLKGQGAEFTMDIQYAVQEKPKKLFAV